MSHFKFAHPISALALVFLALSIAPPIHAQGAPALDSEESAFLGLINNYRAQNGAGPLQVSVALRTSSLWMSNDLAANNYFSHTDSLGRSAGARIQAFGYPYYPWGENIAAGYSDAQTELNQWINACDPDGSGNCSYAHRLNMLNPSFVVIGIGRAYNASSTYKWYWTTDFGGVVDQILGGGGGAPPTVSQPVINSFTASQSSVTAGQPVTLAWNVSSATSISIDNSVGSVGSYNAVTVYPVQTTSYTLTASNTAGSNSAVVTVQVTSPLPTQPPSVPTIISATARSASQVDLTWTASLDNLGIAGYQVIRNGSVIASVPGATLAYSDLSVSAGSSYTYAVKAYDSAGNYSAPSNGAQVTTPSPAPSGLACPGPSTGTFTGCYYNNTVLAGNPVFVRTDNQVNFNWGGGSPDGTLQPNNFSVRWQGIFAFTPGRYTFNVTTSDGTVVYIDGAMVFDRWGDQSPSSYAFPQTLSQGNHLIVIEYYERSGSATAQVSWRNISPSGQGPSISSFTATPSSTTPGQPVTLVWNVSNAASISIDNGIGDVTGRAFFTVAPAQTTTYTLTATNSVGTTAATVQVLVGSGSNTQPPTSPTIVSAMAKSATEVDLVWTPSSGPAGVAGYQIVRNGSAIGTVPATTLAYADMSASANSAYTYVVKAYDGAGNYSNPSNTVQLTTPAAAAGGFTGSYYNNTALSGAPALVRTDSQINFDWRYSPPDSSLSLDNFSVRWQGNFAFAPGNYTFNIIATDGIRLYIDGNLYLDRWRDQAGYWYKPSLDLSQGNHQIVVEHYEHTGGATAQVYWQQN